MKPSEFLLRELDNKCIAKKLILSKAYSNLFDNSLEELDNHFIDKIELRKKINKKLEINVKKKMNKFGYIKISDSYLTLSKEEILELIK